jgi:hypothetical protein
MRGFVWKNQRGVEGVGFVRALRTLLTSNLPDLVESLHFCVKDQFNVEFSQCAMKNSEYSFRLSAERSLLIEILTPRLSQCSYTSHG